MNLTGKPVDPVLKFKLGATSHTFLRFFRATSVIITFCDTALTEFDIQNFIELGLRIIRYKITDLSKDDKLVLLEMLDRALKWCCQKYNVSTWPMAINIDIPNAVIKTGFLCDELTDGKKIMIEDDSIVEFTCDKKYWKQCNKHRIVIDDPYALPLLEPGTEITIDFGSVVIVCTEKIDNQTVKCKVLQGGKMKSGEFVCIRGIKHTKPVLAKKDVELIKLAKESKVDIITINSVRCATTVSKVRSLFEEPFPLIVSTICEQEGLDNIDSIIKASDGIILAREFVVHEIKNKYKMISIQLQVNAKCKKYGKPFFISGNTMENILNRVSGNDLSDLTNSVMQGSGVLCRKIRDPTHLKKALHIFNDVCETAESMTLSQTFWTLSMEYKIPTNAAEAAVLSAVLLAKNTHSMVIIIPTVSGKTVKQVVRMSSDTVILAITSNAIVARHLLLYRGVISIIYEKRALKNWYLEMEARIKFAIEFGIRFEVLQYGGNYVILRKSHPTSSYCDCVIAFKAYTEEERHRLELSTRKKK